MCLARQHQQRHLRLDSGLPRPPQYLSVIVRRNSHLLRFDQLVRLMQRLCVVGYRRTRAVLLACLLKPHLHAYLDLSTHRLAHLIKRL